MVRPSSCIVKGGTFHLTLALAMEGKVLCVQQLVLQFLNEETLSTTPNTAKLS